MANLASPITQQFVQTCLRARLHPAALEIAREMAQREGFDWEEAFNLARDELVTPLLYAVLQDEADLPPAVRQKMRATYLYTSRRNRALLAELVETLPFLEAAGVRPILLKGTALLNTVYAGDLGVRQLRDTDFFIEHGQAAALVTALSEAGYAPANADVRGESVIAYEGEVLLRKRDIVETLLEIHTRLLESPMGGEPIPASWFRRRVVALDIGGAAAWVLAPEAHLVYLAAHTWVHHSARGLLWLHEIAEAVSYWQADLDWEAALDFILHHAIDVRGPVSEVLLRVATEWDAPVPPQVLARLQDAGGQGAVASLGLARLPGPWQRLRANLAVQGGLAARAAYLWRIVLPAPGYMLRRYHVAYPILLPLYYPLRWLEGLRRLWP